MDIATFTSKVGEQFTVMGDTGEPLTLTLFEATPLPAHPYPNKQRDPFQLKFRASGPALLTQRTHTLHHADLGTFPIFLVPLGPDRHGMIYQAVYT